MQETKARYLSFQGLQFFTDNKPKEGDELKENNDIVRYRNGYVHADEGPAIECDDGHLEYWKNGRLHREQNLPAIISDYGDTEEFWLDGKRRKG